MHTESEIAWCLANRELIMRWLEERGGWQDGDRGLLPDIILTYIEDPGSGSCLFYDPNRDHWYSKGHEHLDGILWLPTIDDVLGLLEKVWPVIEINIDDPGSESNGWPRIHVEATAACVTWCPDGGGPWHCTECGDGLHRQDNGTFTYGPFPDEITDEAFDEWDGGSKLPVCPHCGHAEGEDLLLALLELLKAVRNA